MVVRLLSSLLVMAALALPAGAAAQISWTDLVFTGGMSAEAYNGNLAAVTVPAVDSTDEASAAVGELGVRGDLFLYNRDDRSITLRFDGGLRQFAAGGFQVRDYAPRELVATADLGYRGPVGTLGVLSVSGGVRGRWVDDRPPMPLFLQPGYGTVDGRIRFQLYEVGGVFYDVQLFGERADYSTDQATPQLDLLDRKIMGIEVGAAVGREGAYRLHAGFRSAEYENQGTFDPSDPFRRDKALNLGASWTRTGRVTAHLGVEGILNRSNSSRPEYDAVSLTGVVSFPLPNDLSLNFFALLTAKRYVTESESAQLVPGEEADNASVVYLELSRPLLLNLDGAVRFGWNRAETNIGDAYYERFGASFLVRYRPFQ
jgi:hypothetical protein